MYTTFTQSSENDSAVTPLTMKVEEETELEGATDASPGSGKGGGKFRKKSKEILLCAVCGDISHGTNFDAVSCESCKAFFRRNAMKEKVILYVMYDLFL